MRGVLSAVIIASGFYASWAIWVAAAARRGDVEAGLFDLLLEPDALWEIVSAIASEGSFTVAGCHPTGIVLWLCWAVEAVVIVGIPCFLSIAGKPDPFCERCNTWCEPTEGVLTVAGDTDVDMLTAKLDAGAIDYLAQTPRATSGSTFYRLDMQACGSCRNLSTLSLLQVTTEIREGKVVQTPTPIIENRLLDGEQMRSLLELAGHRAGVVAREEALADADAHLPVETRTVLSSWVSSSPSTGGSCPKCCAPTCRRCLPGSAGGAGNWEYRTRNNRRLGANGVPCIGAQRCPATSFCYSPDLMHKLRDVGPFWTPPVHHSI